MLSRTLLGSVTVVAVAAGLAVTGCAPASNSNGTISGVVLARRLAGGGEGVAFKDTWQFFPIQVRVEALEHGETAATVATSKDGFFHTTVNAGHYLVRIVSHSSIYDVCVSKPASITVRKKATVRIKGVCYPKFYPG